MPGSVHITDEHGRSLATTDSAGNPAGNVVVSDRPAYPSQLYLNSTATGAAASTIYTSGDISMYNRFTIEVSGLTATSADVYVSIDGTNYVAMIPFDASTGAPFATTAITANGIYYIDGKYNKIRVDQVGAGAVTVRFSHSVI